MRRVFLRMSHAARPHKRRARMTPPAMPPLRPALPVDLPPVLGVLVGFDGLALVLLPGVLVVFDGLRPNGQKSPPLGGSTQVKELPSGISTKLDEIDIDDVVLSSVMNGAGVGTVSDVEQFGPRAPMNE